MEIADEPVRFASRAATSLLAFLVLGGPRRVSRSLITGTFWPEMSEVKARRRLSQALWQITSTLDDGARLLEAEREHIEVIGSDTWVDVWAFDQCLEQVRSHPEDDHFFALRDAAALMGGELCDGVSDDWLVAWRERYRERFAYLLSELVQAHKARAELDEALDVARRVVELNEFAEEPHREVMRLLHLLGRSAEAVEHYDRLQSLLDRELGSEPEPETRALLDRLLDQGDIAPVEQQVADAETAAADERWPVVGRDRERSLLRRTLDEALVGSGGVALVEGNPGIGKSHLLRDLGEAARWRGFDVATITGRGVGAPFAAVLPAIGAALPRLRVFQIADTIEPIWLQELAALVPRISEWLPDLGAPEALAPAESQRRRTEALVQALVAAAAIRPLLVVVEDLHEADAETLAVVRGLGLASPRRELVVAIGYRPGESRQRSEVWQTLVDLEPVVRRQIRLLPLDRPALSALAFNAGIEIGAERLDEIQRETGGNPLFALETLRAHAEHADRSGAAIADSVQSVIASRVALISAGARSALEAVAVLDRPADVGEILRLSQHGGIGALSADLEDLLRRTLVVESGDEFTVPHAQIQRVVYDSIEADQRAAMHAAVTQLEHIPEAELAWHAEAGGLLDRAAGHYAAAAGVAAGAAAYLQAVDHYTSAQRLHWPDRLADSDDVFAFHLAFETALDVIGAVEARRETIERLEAAARGPDQRATAHRRRIAFLAGQGRLDEATRSADELIRWAGEADEHAVVRTAAVVKAHVLLDAGSPVAAMELLDSIDVEVLDASTRLAALGARARALQMMQHHEAANAAWADVRLAASAANDPLAEVEAMGMAGISAAESGRQRDALEAFGQALERSRQLGHRFAIGRNLVNRAALLQHNDPGTALDEYTEAAQIFAEIGNRRGEAFVGGNVADLRQMLFGIDPVAEELCRSAMASHAEMGNLGQLGHIQLIAGRLAHATRDLSAAEVLYRDALDNTAVDDFRFARIQVLAAQARLAIDQGQPVEAVADAREAVAVGIEIDARSFLPMLFAVLADAEAASGDLDAARTTARSGTELVDEFTHAPHLAWWSLSRASREVGDLAAADSALETAWTWVEHMMRNLALDDRKQAFDSNPVLTAIERAWARLQPEVITVELPAIDAPSGRPLRAEDHVTVLWTVAHRDDPHDTRAARAARLVRLADEAARQGAAPTVDHLASALGASRSTVRRTLADLRADGIDVVTRGARD